MTFDPITHLWIILIIWLLLIAFLSWQLWLNRRDKARFLSWIRRLILVLLLLIIALRPAIFSGEDRAGGMRNVDVYFVVDITPSMGAEDYENNQPRLDAVKQDIRDILPLMAGAKFSVITFGSDTYLELPFTTDASAVRMAIDSIHLEGETYVRGSSIDTPIDFLKEQLENGKQKRPERKRFVYYISDGEQTVDNKPKSFSSLSGLVDGGAVMGYGTDSGGRMKKTSIYNDESYIRDRSILEQVDAVSKIDEKELKTVAEQMGIDYEYRGKKSDVSQVIDKIDTSTLASDKSDVSASSHQDIYWIFAILFVIGVAWEFWTMRSDLIFIRKVGRHGK